MIASGDGFESRGGDWRVGCDEVRKEAPVRPEVGLAGNARPVKAHVLPSAGRGGEGDEAQP